MGSRKSGSGNVKPAIAPRASTSAPLAFHLDRWFLPGMRNMRVIWMGCLLAASLSAGCDRESGQAASGSIAGELLGGHEVKAAGLVFEVPATWQPTAPASTMRKAQVKIPGEGGEAELAVFHFGEGQGGRVEDNLVRWIGQIESAKGEGPEREFFEAGPFAVTLLSATGTLKAGQMGMGPKEAQPGSMLLAAVVEGPGGPWFFKATGPEKTLAPQRDTFASVLKSARAE